MRSIVRKHLPRALRNKLRRLYYFPVDAANYLLGKRDPLTPPRGMMFVGRGDFRETGEEYLETFVALGGLTPNDRVLDVGCGIGQMAVPLTAYLEGGSYEGFDIVGEGIRWCRQHITLRFPNFRFQLADNFNREYNPNGKQATADYRFPYADASFDFVFLTSVFTHMLPRDLERYLSEVARVLDNGKTALITYFLLECSDLDEGARREGELLFRHEVDGCRSIDDRIPEKGIAYPEPTIRALYKKYGMKITEPIHYGIWRERGDLHRSQDVIVAVKSS